MKGIQHSSIFFVAVMSLLLLSASPAFAAGNCSPYLGQASINEFFKDKANQANDVDDFVEVKIIDPAVDFAVYSQWTIQICERNEPGNKNDDDGCSAKISLADFTDTVSPWLVLKNGSIGNFYNYSTGFDAILLDENDDVIDYLKVNGYTLQEQSGCTDASLAYDFDSSSPGTQIKFIYRIPDGTGNWDGQKSAAALPTEGGPNDGIVAPAADHLSIGHDGFAINCLAEQIIISAHTAAHAIDSGYTGTVNLTTSSGNGNWSYVSGGSITRFTNNGGGSASYEFDGSEGGQVVLALFNPVDETISINAGDGSISETSGAAVAADDPPLDFNLAGLQFLGDGVVNNIGTQIAGKPSNTGHGAQLLQIQAWNTNESTFACETLFNSAGIPVEFSLECVNPNTCLRPVYIGSAAPDTVVTTLSTVNLDFSISAQSLANFVLDYPDAGRILLRAQVTLPNGEVVSGASLPFVSRPFGFDGEVVGNPAATDQNGPIFTTAGTPFQVTGAAHLWGADNANDGIPDGHDNDDPSDNTTLQNNTVTLGGTVYSGVPNFGQEGETVDLGAALVAPFLSTFPDPDFPIVTLSSFTNGGASTNSARFDDVGIIELRAYITDGDYLDIGADETARMTSRSTYVGRFVPAFFDITPENGMFANTCTTATTPFTYIGQPFGYDVIRPGFIVRAMNALPTPTVTQNYTGLWAKLSDSSVSGVIPTSDSTQTGADSTTLMSLTYTPDVNLFTITDNTDGTVTFEFGDDEFRYDKDSNSEISEFLSDIDLTITAVVDADGVSTMAAFTLTPDPVRLRFGRIKMSNVHGSELIDLQMPMIVEYFNGGFYQTHVDDSCTQFNDADLIAVDNLTVPGSSTIFVTPPATAIGGDIGITLTAPGAGITGQIDLTGQLSGGVIDNQWLQYDWNGDGLFDNDPTASATFGIFGGNDVNIYMQQIFR